MMNSSTSKSQNQQHAPGPASLRVIDIVKELRLTPAEKRALDNLPPVPVPPVTQTKGSWTHPNMPPAIAAKFERRRREMIGAMKNPLSQNTMARRFAEEYQAHYLYCNREWLVWSNGWRKDTRQELMRQIRCWVDAYLVAIEEKAKANGLEELLKKIHKSGDSYKSASTIRAIENLAQTDERFVVTPVEFDTNPMLLALPGAVTDLKTGRSRPIEPNDLMLKSASVVPEGACPVWMGFLDTVTGGDEELQEYLKRVSGYCLTGSVAEHSIFFFYGSGGNGKGTFLRVLQGILGDYATTMPVTSLMGGKFGNTQIPADLAKLAGARLAVATETTTGDWDEAKIKLLTGGDRISARFLYQNFFEFEPTHKLIVQGNHVPSVKVMDDGIRRRLHLVPFTVKIPKPDTSGEFERKLRQEWPGILKWVIEGCQEWQRMGLAPPPSVVDQTSNYLQDEDTIGTWLGDCCLEKPGARTQSRVLYRSYKSWCDAAGEAALSEKQLIRQLEAKGFDRFRTKSQRGVEGLELKRSAESVAQSA
jgi:putative DNA primase/helicase